MFNAHLCIDKSIRKTLSCVWEACEGGEVILLCTSLRLSFLGDLSQVYLSCWSRSKVRRRNSREGRSYLGQPPTCFIGKTLVLAKSFVPGIILSFLSRSNRQVRAYSPFLLVGLLASHRVGGWQAGLLTLIGGLLAQSLFCDGPDRLFIRLKI